MKTFTQTLMAATAMSLVLSSGAMADSNKAYIDQTGERNSALIDQSGATNSEAGAAVSTALPDAVIRQLGNDNAMTITQTGKSQKAGAVGAGIDQRNNRNLLTITQSGEDNDVQNTNQSGSLTADVTVNEILIEQSDTFNEVKNATQAYRPADGFAAQNTLTIRQSGADATTGNSISKAEQTGAGNVQTITQAGDGNIIGTVSQNNTRLSATATTGVSLGAGNTATITQTGLSNQVQAVKQNGIGNSTILSFDGDDNGSRFTLEGYAAQSGATGRSVLQAGTGNMVDMKVGSALAGVSGNQFGFTQDGTGNMATGITITGNDNELGVFQDGDGNVLGLAEVAGSSNNIGLEQIEDNNEASISVLGSTSANNKIWVSQTSVVAGTGNDATVSVDGSTNDVQLVQGLDTGVGGTNEATVTVASSNNMVDVEQYGDNGLTADITDAGGFNTLTVDQIGTNTADVDIAGASNKITLDQSGTNTGSSGLGADIGVTGDGNVFTVQQSIGNNFAQIDITGNSNGNFFGSGSFDGVAGDLAADAGNGLTNGTISQAGTGNSVTFAIAAPVTGTSTNNLFAFEQRGDGHSIDGTQIGKGNQVAVLQVNAAGGMGNSFSFTQTGMQNIVGGTQ